jgi:outer membrane protein assembly factor BamA
VSGFYSTSKQYGVALAPQMYFLDNALFVSLGMFYSDKTYFTPSVTNPEVDAKIYGMVAEIRFPALLKLTAIKQLGLIFDYRHVDVKDDASDDDIPHTLGLGAAQVWDTRDNIFYPLTGTFCRVQAVFFATDLGSSYNFNHYQFDLRQYLNINEDREQVLAFQALIDFVRGSPPFYRLPALGGARIMRGYKAGVMRDRNLLCGQAEFRSHIWRKLGAVAFVGTGDVANEFADFKWKNLKPSFGVGLRYRFNTKENVNLRMDLGFGDNTDGIYFGVQEAF